MASDHNHLSWPVPTNDLAQDVAGRDVGERLAAQSQMLTLTLASRASSSLSRSAPIVLTAAAGHLRYTRRVRHRAGVGRVVQTSRHRSYECGHASRLGSFVRSRSALVNCAHVRGRRGQPTHVSKGAVEEDDLATGPFTRGSELGERMDLQYPGSDPCIGRCHAASQGADLQW